MATASDDEKGIPANVVAVYETLDRGTLVELCYRKDRIIAWLEDALDEAHRDF